jgi:uncharacterized protein (DUF1684 family)
VPLALNSWKGLPAILSSVTVRRFLVGFALAATLAACSTGPPDDEAAFGNDLAAFRAAKDRAFQQADSPIPTDRRQTLLPLAYFPASYAYRVPAVLRVEPTKVTLEMLTSTGQRRMMQRVGKLEFSVKGSSQTLGAFVEVGAPNFDRLFVPFTDLTSGTETYPAGRYLDLDLTKSGIYVLDFNRAYNPYCYYNKTYDCPIPPRENRLQLPIRAGEKTKDVAAPGTAG